MKSSGSSTCYGFVPSFIDSLYAKGGNVRHQKPFTPFGTSITLNGGVSQDLL